MPLVCSWFRSSKPWRPDEKLLLKNILCKPGLEAEGWIASLCWSIFCEFRRPPCQRVTGLLMLSGFKDWRHHCHGAMVSWSWAGALTRKLEKNGELLVDLGPGQYCPNFLVTEFKGMNVFQGSLPPLAWLLTHGAYWS